MERLLPQSGHASGCAAGDDIMYQVGGLLTVLLDSAVASADAYRAAAGRRLIHAADLRLALMYTVLPSSPLWRDVGMPQRAEAARIELAAAAADADGTSSDEDGGAAPEDDEDEAWCAAPPGASQLVDDMNASDEEFARWCPEPGLLLSMKEAVEATLSGSESSGRTGVQTE